tara:strand:+ start:585 stop:1379 length:795 start_codon:yes stop_codon:yes gene_type:complete
MSSDFACASPRAQGERCYHVLYQLCAGCSTDERRELQLLPAAEFRFLGDSARMQASLRCPLNRELADSPSPSPSHPLLASLSIARSTAPAAEVQVPGIDDAAGWRATCEAVEMFQLAPAEREGLRRLLSSVLHLGNLQFNAVQLAQQDDGSAVSAEGQPRLQSAALLLAVSPSALEQALTIKSVGKFPVVQVPQPPSKAEAARDALAKAIYGQVFDWLLSCINAKMSAPDSTAALDSVKRTIGLEPRVELSRRPTLIPPSTQIR